MYVIKHNVCKMENKAQATEMVLKTNNIINIKSFIAYSSTLLSREVHIPWVCEAVQRKGRAGLQGRAWKCEMGPVGHLWGKGWPWTACWPGGPEDAVPPPLAFGGAALLQPDLHRLPRHTAYREEERRKNVV